MDSFLGVEVVAGPAAVGLVHWVVLVAFEVGTVLVQAGLAG